MLHDDWKLEPLKKKIVYIKDGVWQVRLTLIMYYRGWGSANPSPRPLSGMRCVVGGGGDQMWW